jgi:hypothetical protein
VLALVVALPHRTSADGDGASCGSVLLPVDTWDDCIDTRNQAALTSGVFAFLAFGLGVGALIALARNGSESEGSGPRTTRLALAALGAVALVSAALAIAIPVEGGGRDCGIVRLGGNDMPLDEFGNFDSACMDAFQRRWLVVAGLLTAGIVLLVGSTRALSRRGGDSRGRIVAWLATVSASGGFVLMLVMVIELALARRGGA